MGRHSHLSAGKLAGLDASTAGDRRRHREAGLDLHLGPEAQEASVYPHCLVLYSRLMQIGADFAKGSTQVPRGLTCRALEPHNRGVLPRDLLQLDVVSHALLLLGGKLVALSGEING
jgi:hypothetical protein